MTTPTQGGKPTSFYLSELEQALLEHIRRQEGHRTSKSAIVAKMIVQDAERRNIDIDEVALTLTAGQPAQAS
jgi:DNA-binding response OmpR family regulator